jgi:hypothetical protein
MHPSKCYHHVVNGVKKDMWSVEFDGGFGNNCAGYAYPQLYKDFNCNGNTAGSARGSFGSSFKCWRYGPDKKIGSFKSFRLGCQPSQGG